MPTPPRPIGVAMAAIVSVFASGLFNVDMAKN
jgi:hypothetical protein